MTTLKIKKVANKNPKTQVAGFTAKVISNGTKSFTDLAKEACRNTTLHEAEAELASKLLIEAVTEALKNGYIVDLGTVGKLRPGCQSKWVANAADLTKDDIKPRVNFDPSDEVEGAVKAAKLQWTSAADEEADGGSDHSGDNEQGGGQGGDDDPDGGGALS